jgi:hypothetical protein
MAITSYSTLKTAIASWSHRADLDSYLDDFIDFTEARMNRELRVSQMETRATTTPSDAYIALPTDCLAIRNIQLNTNPVQTLEYVTPAEMDRLANGQTEAGNYTIIGDEIQLDASTSYTVEIAYYAKIPALSDTNTTNWVLTTHPDVYLYGCLAEVFKFAQDEAEATKYTVMFLNCIAEIRALDRKRKYSQTVFVRVA